MQYLTEEKAASLSRHAFNAGDVVLNKLGEPTGKVCIVPDAISQGIIVADIIRIRLNEEYHDKQYIVHCMNSPIVAYQFSGLAKGVTRQRVNLSQVRSLKVPLPPLKEQRRIVGRVDELMALCDQLEQQTESSLLAHQTLVETLLNTLLNADQNSFDQAWERIAQHFDVLFTTEHSIDQLKQTILQLAVMGKLVPQDPNDEPASVLLEKIAAEKEQLIKDKVIKKQKVLSPVEVDEELFKLPTGWAWSRIGEFSLIGPRNLLDDDLEVSFVPMPLISTSYKGDHEQEVRLWSELKKGYTHFANGDIGLAKITPCFENSKASIFSDLKNGFGAGTTELHIARPLLEEINPLFVLLYLKAPMFLEVGKTKMTGSAGQKRIPKSFFEGNPFPLPPEAEQPRIVAKVDELMTLCDELKVRLQEAQETKLHLADAMAEQALNS